MEKVSVIIPVRNGEATLAKAVRSVTSQSYDNIEVIIVDDTSTDKTPEIATALASKDKRITVITRRESTGTDTARLDGISNASGDYIMFTDADDMLTPGIIEQCVHAVHRQRCDIISFGTYWRFPYIPHKIRINAMHHTLPSTFFNRGGVEEFIYPHLISQTEIMTHMWDKFYSRDLIMKATPGAYNRRTGEDWLFNAQVMAHAGSFAVIPYYGYIWNFTGGNSKYLIERWDELKSNYNLISTIIDNAPLSENGRMLAQDALTAAICRNIVSSASERLNSGRYSRQEIMDFIAKEIQHQMIAEAYCKETNNDKNIAAVRSGNPEIIFNLAQQHIKEHRFFYIFMRIMKFIAS